MARPMSSVFYERVVRMKKTSTAMSSTLRCLKMLELLAEEPFELSFSELAARLDIPKASAHRLCTTLIEANLITQEPATRRYMLNSHALWIGSGYLRHSPLYRAAFFPMQELARQVPGTVQLYATEVVHTRRSPIANHFRYRASHWLGGAFCFTPSKVLGMRFSSAATLRSWRIWAAK